MSSTYDYYEKEAARCLDMAKEARSDKLRAKWLELAGRWLAMIPGREKTLTEKFDAVLGSKRTHQKDSDASH
jgi:hypothetical protein